ncbi:shikimate dehydrogenase [Candidatus Falkowbacteria bacterium]|nr:shikimate dehydrogenase [Candidatus Falkowbacteria bacterium]
MIGDPVEHSVSDFMFRYFAKLTGIENYNHLKIKISKADLENLKITMKAIAVFGFMGANITLPYKEKAIKYLDIIDKTVQRIGAVNTIVNKKGKLIGYNTDGHGAIKAVETKLRPLKSADRVVVFGAGGAARAIIGSLPQVSHLTVLNRPSDFNQAEKLKKDFIKCGSRIETKSLTDRNIVSAIREADFVINATPVGMYPKTGASLIYKSHFDSIGRSRIKNLGFFDAVFNPFETEFLKLAKQYGAKTCPGIYMMIYQGIKAFRLWTGKVVSEGKVEEVRRLLQKTINSRYGK